MNTLLATIQPRTAFVTPLKGDTLFGQLCWAVHHLLGKNKLTALLANYSQTPFVVLSDPFPEGYLPRPVVPASLLGSGRLNASERKAEKKCNRVPLSVIQQPLLHWQKQACSDKDIFGKQLYKQSLQPHNSISRITGTTGEGDFAPYQVNQYWHLSGVKLSIHISLDKEQLSTEQLQELLIYIGQSGYGKEASTGLGKFDVIALEPIKYACSVQSNAWLTLAPSVVSMSQWQTKYCFYQPFTRFGRHGDQLALSGQPFKNPVLMLDSGALLTPVNWQETSYIGQAIGGQGELSKAMPETIHQGYSPVVPVFVSGLSGD